VVNQSEDKGKGRGTAVGRKLWKVNKKGKNKNKEEGEGMIPLVPFPLR
jgi:hypothetical protein